VSGVWSGEESGESRGVVPSRVGKEITAISRKFRKIFANFFELFF
jgi:hypothetical protein